MLKAREYWLISSLGEVAWADGVLHAREARLFLEVIAGLDLPEKLIADVYRAVLNPDARTLLDPSQLDEDDRRWILGFGYLMSAADGDVSDVELSVLRGIAKRLDVPWDRAERIFQEAEQVRHTIGDGARGAS